MNKTKVLQALLWFWAACEFINALLSTFFLDAGAGIYGFASWVENPQTRFTFHQYGMVLFVLATIYVIIATDVVKYERLLWVIIAEQIIGAVFSVQGYMAGVLTVSQLAFILTIQVIITALVFILKPQPDAPTTGTAAAAR
ncbi:MAG: hypothetical protein IAF08_01400 [Rhizobacter sp.]|nr:hypothetical protein [Chlorobiales bacterium]